MEPAAEQSGAGKRPQWKRFVAAGVLLAFALPVVLVPFIRAERQRKLMPPGVARGPRPDDPVAHLSTGPVEYPDAQAIQSDYRAALTSYEAFMVRADSDIAYLERFCGGEQVNPEEGIARTKSMAQFFQNARNHEIDMYEMRRVASLKGVDLGRPPWETRQNEVKELNLRLQRAQEACRERNREAAKAER